jgi:hypothetical protein
LNAECGVRNEERVCASVVFIPHSALRILHSLVPRHPWLDLDRPLIDAAGHALSLCKSLFAEPRGNLRAAAPKVAIDDNAAIGKRRELPDSHLNLAHRHQDGAANGDQLVFVRLAAVDEDSLVVRVEHRLGIAAGYFKGSLHRTDFSNRQVIQGDNREDAENAKSTSDYSKVQLTDQLFKSTSILNTTINTSAIFRVLCDLAVRLSFKATSA